MASSSLQSKLFRSDRALELCLVQDSAHITPGTSGDHVSKIHTALLVLDNVNVASRELSSQQYGPSTAAAVLAFKRRRGIINKTYQTQADDIVGKMTIAAMDSEMLLAERATLFPPDPRKDLAST